MYPFVKVAARPGKEFAVRWLGEANRLIHLTEYEMLRRGYRKADVLHVYPESFDQQMDQVVEDGLVWVPIRRSRRWQGFAHKHYPVRQLDFDSLVYGVVARDRKTAYKFREADMKGDHATIGRLLGYPECAIKFFLEVWPRHVDPIPEAALNTEGVEVDGHVIKVKGHPYLWQGLRYFGPRVVPWLVDSYSCPECLKKAELWAKVAKSINDEWFDHALELLSARQEWDLDNGVAFVKHPYFFGASNSEGGRWVVKWDT